MTPAGGELDRSLCRQTRGSGSPRPGAVLSPTEAAESIRIHDLKNLACRLTTLLQNLTNHYSDPLFKQSALEVLRDTVDQMNQMVHRYCRSPGRVIVKLKLDLNDILADIVREIPLETFPRVRIREEYRAIPPIWGDDYYLRTALLSIIVNALEAMSSGGVLTLRTGSTGIGRRSRVALEVEDTGCGMTRSFVRHRLYSPFATTKPHGLGLGLYNARQVIDLHGGEIVVRSSPRHGTTFRLLFDAPEEDVS